MMITTVSYILAYLLFSVGGATLMKYGGLEHVKKLITIPIIDMNLSIISLIGFFSYGISFILYIIILNKYDITFVTIFSIGVVYVLLTIIAFVVFKEPFSISKIIGSGFILTGILIMIFNK